jgi:hypothetical protein
MFKVLAYFLTLFLISCGNYLTVSNLLEDDTEEVGIVPESIIHPFSLSSCPTGWSVFTEGKGRALLGSGSGNFDEDANPLTVRALLESGGVEYKTAIPYSLVSSTEGSGTNNILGTADTNVFRDTRDLTQSFGTESPIDSNLMPFKVYIYCEKNSLASGSIPAGAVISQDLAICSGDWSSEPDLSGRGTIGQGSGNTDRDSGMLAVRSLGETGGREGVKGIAIGSEAGGSVISSTSPGFNTYLGNSSPGTLYSISPPSGNCLSEACKDDPNLPPFIALSFCKLVSNSDKEYPSKTVSAFNRSDCPFGWSDYSLANGRIIIGSGAGNFDTDGIALTGRSTGETGGWEKTNSIPLGAGAGTQGTATGNYLALNSLGETMFSSDPIDGYTGEINDSNIPPFIVVKYCIKD